MTDCGRDRGERSCPRRRPRGGERGMRLLPSVTLGVAAFAASFFAFGAEAGPPWGPETTPFNIEVILRDVTGGSGFGHVKVRQPNDTAKNGYPATLVRDPAPAHTYRLQHAGG